MDSHELMESGENASKRLREDNDSPPSCVLCEQSGQKTLLCEGCRLPFCSECSKLPEQVFLYIHGNVTGTGITYKCKACKITQPPLEVIKTTLKDYTRSNDIRISKLETRISDLELNTRTVVQEEVGHSHAVYMETMRSNVIQFVDDRNKEYEDRRNKELNVILFGVPEKTDNAGQVKKQKDKEDICELASSLGLTDVTIVANFRLGRLTGDNIRPLIAVLGTRAQRKYLLEKAFEINSKAPERLKNVVLKKDMTKLQREERKARRGGNPYQQVNPTNR